MPRLPRLRVPSAGPGLLILGAVALLTAGCGPTGSGGGGGDGGTDGGMPAADGGFDGGSPGTDGGSTVLTGSLTLDLVAGDTRGPGAYDGKGTVARFDFPRGIVGDGAGNLYVADSTNETIRKIDPTEHVTTLAGMADRLGEPAVDGTGTDARFLGLDSIALGPGGDLYVTEVSDIRKITPAGVVTTLASSLGPQSRPTGIAVDAAGNVYFADLVADTVRKVTPGGTVTTLAGRPGVPGSADGAGSAARFDQPIRITLGPGGNLWVADSNGIRKVTPAGVVTTPYPHVFAGSGLGFDPAGDLVIAPAHEVERIDASGTLTLLAGSTEGYADGRGASAEFGLLNGLYVDGSGNVFVTDLENSDVREIDSGGTVTTVAGSAWDSRTDVDGAATDARFANAREIAADGAGGAYVMEEVGNHAGATLRHVDASGAVTTVFSDQTGIDDRDLAATPDGTVYVVDTHGATPVIDTVDAAGHLTPVAGGASLPVDGTGTAAGFSEIKALAAGPDGNLYATDYDASRLLAHLRQITPAGQVSTRLTQGGLGWPGIAVGPDGKVYGIYGGNVVSLDPTGSQSVAGTPGAKGNADGQGNAARFHDPQGLAVGAGGDIFVADTYNGLLRRVTPGGTVTTLVGVRGQRKAVPGPVPTTLDLPEDVTFAADGSLLVLEDTAVLRLHPR